MDGEEGESSEGQVGGKACSGPEPPTLGWEGVSEAEPYTHVCSEVLLINLEIQDSQLCENT